MDRFERLVKQLFQLTPHQLLIKTRVDAASRMLRDEALTIAEVAHACGYGDHSAFTRQFRATVGLTPRAFRARHAATDPPSPAAPTVRLSRQPPSARPPGRRTQRALLRPADSGEGGFLRPDRWTHG